MVSELIFSLLGIAVLYFVFNCSLVISFPTCNFSIVLLFLLLLEAFNSNSVVLSAFSGVVVKNLWLKFASSLRFVLDLIF